MATTNMRTTTLIIETPNNFEQLKTYFRLERYVVPSQFDFKTGKRKFSRLHTNAKIQLGVPYHLFTHDTIDNHKKTAIYALYERNAPIQSLQLNFVSEEPLEHREIDFHELELHNLIKLLQSSYFRTPNINGFSAENGQSFIFAKQTKYAHFCLEIKIQGNRQNNNEGRHQAFHISGHATRFIENTNKGEIESWKAWAYPRYKRTTRDGQMLFSQIHPNDVNDFKEPQFSIYRNRNSKATLDFHDQLRIDRSRGKILSDFTYNFIDYLSELGLNIDYQYRNFYEHKTSSKGGLDLKKLKNICLFDNRINKDTVSIADYLEILKERYQEIQIEGITDLSQANNRPVLMLQDNNAVDFEKDGLLAKFSDPYKVINDDPNYKDIPKQSISINPNDAGESDDLEIYLEYENVADTPPYQMRFDVSIYQLFLKYLVQSEKSIVDILPGVTNDPNSLSQYVFIRKQTYSGESHMVASYIENGILRFLDLHDPVQRSVLYDLLNSRDIDLDIVLEQLARQYFKSDPDQLPRFDLIVGNNIAIEIEDINERILYDYDEIEDRLQGVEEPKPIETFMLVEHYDQIKNADMYSLSQLNGSQNLSSTKESRSREFLEKLQNYDRFLDELYQTQMEISYKDLTSGDRLERIGSIFNLARMKTKDGHEGEAAKYKHAKLKGYYQKMGMFLSPKKKDVILYQGIWYDDENCYLVGDPNSLKDKQDKASVVRKFNILIGNKVDFDIGQLLDTMAVQFVRNKRYTVHSYFFHLIDLFVSKSRV